MSNRFFITILIFSLTACGGGLTGSGALNSPGAGSNSPDTESGSEFIANGRSGDPLPAPASAAADPVTDPSLAYYYLPTKGPRIAAAPGGPLGAPVDDDRVGAVCFRILALSDPNNPTESLDPHYEISWHPRDGEPLKRRLLVSQKDAGITQDVQIRVLYVRPAEATLWYRDFLLLQLASKGQEIEITMENPQFDDELKVFYLPPEESTDPQELLSKKCANYKFGGSYAAWTPGNYEDYAQGPGYRIFVNQIGHFTVEPLLLLMPQFSAKPALGNP